jgi:hypothetical protein
VDNARLDTGGESARAHLNNARQSLLTMRALAQDGVVFSADEIQSLITDVLRRLTEAERELYNREASLSPVGTAAVAPGPRPER